MKRVALRQGNVRITRDSKRTRENILDAAKEIFLAEGYHNTNVDKISQRAGVGYGTVYSHFRGGKSSILNGTTEHICDQMQDQLRNLQSNHNNQGSKTAAYIEQKLYEQTEGMLNVSRKNREYLQIVVEAKGESLAVREHWQKQQCAFADEVERQIRVNQNLGLAVKLDAHIISSCFCSILWHYFWEDILHDENLDIKEIALHIVRFYMWGVYSDEARQI